MRTPPYGNCKRNRQGLQFIAVFVTIKFKKMIEWSILNEGNDFS